MFTVDVCIDRKAAKANIKTIENANQKHILTNANCI